MLYEDQFRKKVSEWKLTAEQLSEITQNDADERNLAGMVDNIVKCGNILDTYAGLIQFAAQRYQENEKSLIRALED